MPLSQQQKKELKKWFRELTEDRQYASWDSMTKDAVSEQWLSKFDQLIQEKVEAVNTFWANYKCPTMTEKAVDEVLTKVLAILKE